jgi:hypothetical protein
MSLEHKIPAPLESLILRRLEAQGFSVGQMKGLSPLVQKLSDFYISHSGGMTPWDEKQTLPAYLGYFLPLNSVRLQAAFREVVRFIPSDSVNEIWDFGSGLGASHWVLEASTWAKSAKNIFCLESSRVARTEHQEMAEELSDGLHQVEWPTFKAAAAAPGPRALAIFSYSFLEMIRVLPDLNRFSHILVVEPSTRERGRALMDWREHMITKGFTPLAPCTHSAPCPLLHHSAKDWCHHRVHFSAPDWFHEIESELPMKNRTLTFSYLLMSRETKDTKWRGAARVIGDTLKEKGKTRQLICRGPEREFLSWLHKQGEAPGIPHGALIADLTEGVIKGSEVRMNPDHPLDWME